MKFVCKVQVSSITTYFWGEGKKVSFNPVQNEKGASTEDLEFHRHTPSGSIDLHIDNPAVLDNLKAGDYFYVTFDKC